MNNIIAKNKEEVENYKQKIFAMKAAYRRELTNLSFEKKMDILVKLQARAKCLKKFQLKNKTTETDKFKIVKRAQ